LLILVVGAAVFQFVLGFTAAVWVILFAVGVLVSWFVYRRLNRGPIAWDEPLVSSRIVASAIAAALFVGLAIQAVPYGWDRSNPPVTGEPPWDSPRTRELAVRACFDCHSNEVDYPWYSRIAPVSWAVQFHVDQGRDEVNYSEWNLPQPEGDESAETVIEGEMPPFYYSLLTHREARLTETERRELIDGFESTVGLYEDDEEDEEDD
jgi:hypothetical protein